MIIVAKIQDLCEKVLKCNATQIEAGTDADNEREDESDKSDFEDLEGLGKEGNGGKDAKGEGQPLTGASKECYKLLKQLQAREVEERIRDTDDTGGVDSADSVEAHRNSKSSKSLDDEHVRECLVTDASADVDAMLPNLDDIPEATLPKNAHDPKVSCASKVSDTRSLFALFQHPTVREDAKNKRLWVHLWKLLVRLRADDGQGCDSSFIKSHRTCRWISQNRHWHQQAEHCCRIVNQQSGLSASRTSRVQAWKSCAASAAKKVLTMEESKLPEVLSAGQVVLLLVPLKQQAWRVALVLSVWTIAGKKVKATHLPVPVPKAHSIRVALMDPLPDHPEGTFQADDSSLALVTSPFRIAVVLDCIDKAPSVNNFMCRLTHESLEAAQRAHLIKQWPKSLLGEVEKDSKILPAKTSAMAMSPPHARRTKQSKGVLNSPKLNTGGRADDVSSHAHPQDSQAHQNLAQESQEQAPKRAVDSSASEPPKKKAKASFAKHTKHTKPGCKALEEPEDVIPVSRLQRIWRLWSTMNIYSRYSH